jgi:hypothetical protein
MAYKIVNGLFLLAYLLSAAVQYNDPDALPWALIYLAGAAMCVDQFLHRRFNWLAPALIAVCLCWVLWLLPSIVGQVSLQEIFDSISMKTRAVEEAREIGGLALVLLWAAIVLRCQLKSSTPSA